MRIISYKVITTVEAGVALLQNLKPIRRNPCPSSADYIPVPSQIDRSALNGSRRKEAASFSNNRANYFGPQVSKAKAKSARSESKKNKTTFFATRIRKKVPKILQ